MKSDFCAEEYGLVCVRVHPIYRSHNYPCKNQYKSIEFEHPDSGGFFSNTPKISHANDYETGKQGEKGDVDIPCVKCVENSSKLWRCEVPS